MERILAATLAGLAGGIVTYIAIGLISWVSKQAPLSVLVAASAFWFVFSILYDILTTRPPEPPNAPE